MAIDLKTILADAEFLRRSGADPDGLNPYTSAGAWSGVQTFTKNVTTDPGATPQTSWVSVIENRVTTGPAATDAVTNGIKSTILHGSASVDALGTDVGITSQVQVLGSADDGNEYAAYFGVVRMGTDTKDANGRMWVMDMGGHGPLGVRPALLTGANMHINNYWNAAPVDGPAVCYVASTWIGRGPAIEGAGHDTADTYPMDVGYAVVGKSRAAAADGIGFRIGVQVGGYAGGWMTSAESSIIGTGIDVSQYRDYGIYIHDREASGTGPAARFGGQVHIDNAQAFRGRNAAGSTSYAIGQVNSSDQVALGDSSVLTAVVGSSLQLQTGGTLRLTVGTGTFLFADAFNMGFSGTTGTKIGTATTQKIGFWNATPAVQPTAVADATDAASVITQLNALLARLRTIGVIAT